MPRGVRHGRSLILPVLLVGIYMADDNTRVYQQLFRLLLIARGLNWVHYAQSAFDRVPLFFPAPPDCGNAWHEYTSLPPSSPLPPFSPPLPCPPPPPLFSTPLPSPPALRALATNQSTPNHRQALYFDRYTRLLAPDLDPLRDDRVTLPNGDDRADAALR